MTDPLSTYRLQCNCDFDLHAATRLIPYLQRLGVDCIYCSPLFTATRGSAHGYDVTDPTTVNPELGGRPALDAFSRAAHDAGITVLIDIVPNHQAANDENPYWRRMCETHEPGWFDATWIDGELVYRRFFDIGGLAGVRVEDPAVFAATHVLIRDLIEAGAVDALRVDHVDGLANPGEYLRRLHDLTGGAYVVVEKILARDERLSSEWPVAGTTGYEIGNALTELCIDPDGRAELEAACIADNGGVAFPDFERAGKTLVLDEMLQPEWRRVLGLLDDPVLAPALRSATIDLDVYRTYDASDDDRKRLERATERVDPAAADALRARLLTTPDTELETRWQQLSGAVMAKGHEDTACYRYPALLAQNDVGGDPGASARDAVTRFHALASRFRGLIGTSTHDSKRSEDVRARLCVLSERPRAFEAGLARWKELVAPAPGVTELELRFVAQTLLGAWPLSDAELPDFGPRIDGYLRKALREAKQHTNWIDPDEKHEAAVLECARRTIECDGAMMHEAFGPFVQDVQFFGAVNSLSMLTWKLAMPGTPDIYRGCEIFDFSLVDPDNRRPVDFATRERMLDDMTDAAPDLAGWRSGLPKLWLTAHGLRTRRDRRALFTRGSYVPLDAPDTVLAFARVLDDEWAVAVAPRLATRVTECELWPLGESAWADDIVAGPAGPIRLAEAFREMPCVLLTS
jgi:(1->4)-alpha-D-glucan 1-alpha-D-glucosylmutase